MTDEDRNALAWRKASLSAGNGECVEVAAAAGGVAIRDSKNPTGVILGCSPEAFRSLLSGIKEGDSLLR